MSENEQFVRSIYPDSYVLEGKHDLRGLCGLFDRGGMLRGLFFRREESLFWAAKRKELEECMIQMLSD